MSLVHHSFNGQSAGLGQKVKRKNALSVGLQLLVSRSGVKLGGSVMAGREQMRLESFLRKTPQAYHSATAMNSSHFLKCSDSVPSSSCCPVMVGHLL